MTTDAMKSIKGLQATMLVDAHGMVARCSQLCERVLASQGDRPDAAIVQLQHDCALWHNKWEAWAPINLEEVEDA